MIFPAFTTLLESSTPVTGSAFIPSLSLKEGFATEDMPFSSDDAHPAVAAFSAQQANGRHDPAETPAPFEGFTPLNSADPSRYREEFHRLFKIINYPVERAQAADRYESLARNAVPAFLVCAQTLTTEGLPSAPFLAVVSFPTAFRRGATRRKLRNGPKPVTLNPGIIPGHSGTACVVMASMATSSRDLASMSSNSRSPEEYLKRGTVVCLSDNGALFASVVASTETAPGAFETAFSLDHYQLSALTWATADAMRLQTDGNDTWLAGTPETGTSSCIRLPKFLPLPCPCVLPPGILG